MRYRCSLDAPDFTGPYYKEFYGQKVRLMKPGFPGRQTLVTKEGQSMSLIFYPGVSKVRVKAKDWKKDADSKLVMDHLNQFGD